MTFEMRPGRGSSGVPSFAPGQAVELGLSSDDGSTRWYRSRLEERSADGAWFAVGWPMQQLQLVAVRVGQVAMVMASASDALYAVETVVERAERAEPPRLVLRSGGAWRRVQRRQDVRLPVLIRPTIAQRQTGDQWLPIYAYIWDISASGIRIQAGEPLRVGDQLELSFGLPHGGDDLNLRVRVRRVRTTEVGDLTQWEAGCQFVEPRRADRDRIVRFIFAQQRAQAQRERGTA